jgi:hypothetical protein
MATELGKIPESESARRAFNLLAGSWQVPPFAGSGDENFLDGMEKAALEKNLRLYRFSGDLGALLHIDHPAVLELSIPGLPGKRFVFLSGKANEHLLVEPPFPGRKSLPVGEMERYWSGQAFLLWKDSLDLLAKIWPGSKGGASRQLQELLREAGAYRKPLTGIYDGDTFSAVREFQSSRGIKVDGIAGGQTLMLLYGSIDRFQVPRLTAGRK